MQRQLPSNRRTHGSHQHVLPAIYLSRRSSISEFRDKDRTAQEEEKYDSSHLEHNVEEVAMHGHVATDDHGHSLVAIDAAAERKIRWKIDLRVIPIISLLYLFCFIDRANIGNAKLAGLEKDLKMTGYDYNILITAFYVPLRLLSRSSSLLRSSADQFPSRVRS